MLASTETIEMFAKALTDHGVDNLVLDPVSQTCSLSISPS